MNHLARSVPCTVCGHGERVRRIVPRFGPFVRLLGLILVVIGLTGSAVLLIVAIASTRPRAEEAIFAAFCIVTGGLLLALIGAIGASRRQILWCRHCWSAIEAADAAGLVLPDTGPGSVIASDDVRCERCEAESSARFSSAASPAPPKGPAG